MRVREARTGWFLLSAACYTAWLIPLAEPSRAQDLSVSIGRLEPMPVSGVRAPALWVRRDPFAGEPRPGAPISLSGSDTSGRLDDGGASDRGGTGGTASFRRGDTDLRAGAFDFIGDANRVPDIGGDVAMTGGPDMAGVTLKATIVGRRAVAYVQNGAMFDIVRVGDRLGSRTIVRIDLRGLAFDDGSRLDLAAAYHRAEPDRPPAAHQRTFTIDDLRRALAAPPTLATPPIGTDAPNARASPETPASAPAGPTPGPLPTIDRRGRAPDQTPTSDPSAATPYAVPGIDR